MTTMEQLGKADDPRHTHDDPLLDGLLILSRLHGRTIGRAGLAAGLPLPDQRLTPDLLPRAAARAGLQARLLRRPLEAIAALNLPVLLLFRDGRCAVLRQWDAQDRALILPCETDGGEQWVERETLAGRIFIIMPVMRSNSVAESTTSVFLPAMSSRRKRSTRSSRSKVVAISRPMARTQRVDSAWLGTTRS